MSRAAKLIGLSLVGLTLSGCVSAEQYAGMKLKADQLAEQLGNSQSEVAQQKARADLLDKQVAMLGNMPKMSEAERAALAAQIAELNKSNEDLAQKYQDALKNAGSVGMGTGQAALPQGLDEQLKQFAAANSDLITFDSSRGVVKFKGDLTFAPGDANVTTQAKSAIQRFSTILGSTGAGKYDLLIAGHTDSTPVSNEKTKLHHPDNWYLSAHRAIAVGHELVVDGVSSSRMGVVGYADKQPVANDSTEAGKAANRRVEILIVPATPRAAVASYSDSPSRPTKKAVAVVKPTPAPSGNKQ